MSTFLWKNIKKKYFFLHILLIVIAVVISLGIITKSIVFGSQEGRWVYPYIKNLSPQPFLLFSLFLPLVLFLYIFSKKYIQKYQYIIVLFLCIMGFIMQATIFTVLRGPEYIVEYSTGIGSSPYYVASLRYTTTKLLSEYHEITTITELAHVRSNMPGKILLYQALELLTFDRLTLAYLIILISDLLGILVYAITKTVFDDKTVALTALFLYLLLPAKLFVSPLLNTISPFFPLFSLYVLLRSLRSQRVIWIILWAISIFSMIIFDPLTLTTGPIQFAFIIQVIWKKILTTHKTIRFLAMGGFAFMIIYLLFLIIFRFDAISQLLFIQNDTRHFNLINNRRYPIWVQQNVIDLFLNAGLLASVFYIVFLISITWKGLGYMKRKFWRSGFSFVFQSRNLLFFSFTMALLLTDLSGIIRGEIIRLWIFFAVFIEILAGYAIARIGNRTTLFIVLASILLQSVLSLSMVTF